MCSPCCVCGALPVGCHWQSARARRYFEEELFPGPVFLSCHRLQHSSISIHLGQSWHQSWCMCLLTKRVLWEDVLNGHVSGSIRVVAISCLLRTLSSVQADMW